MARRLIRAALLTILVSGSGTVRAQTETLAMVADETTSGAVPLTEAHIQELLKSAQEPTAADDDVRQKQIGLYKLALEQVRLSDQWTSRAVEFDTARAQAPVLAVRLKEELAEIPEEISPEVPEGATLQQLEQLMSGPQQELADMQKLAGDLSSELKRRADRRLEIPRLISAARQRLEELRVEEAAGPLPDEPAEVTGARMLLVAARRQALEREIQAHEKELQSYEARSELLALRQDDTSRRVSRLEKLVKAWQGIINDRRRGEAEQAAIEARRQRQASANAHPLVRRLTEENAALAEQRTGGQGLSARIETVTNDLRETNANLEALREQAKGLRSKVEAVGLSDAIGILLRKQREEVGALLEKTRHMGRRKEEIAEVHLRLLELEDELAALRDFDGAVETVMADYGSRPDEADRDEIQAAVRELLQARRSYLQALIKDSNSYFSKLIELDTLEKQFLEEARQYAKYIDERILWIPSSSVLSLKELAAAPGALQDLVSSEHIHQAWSAWTDDLEEHLWVYGLGILAPLALLAARRRLWKDLVENCQKAGRSGSLSFYSAVRACAATALLAFPLPYLAWFAGWRLDASAGDSGFLKALADGIMAAAAALFVLGAVRTASARQGLGAVCFQWSPEAVRILRRNALWLLLLALPVRILVEIAQWHGTENRQETAARVLFMIGMAACAFFAHRTLQPSRGVIPGTIAREREGWLYRLRHLWYASGVGIPVLLALGSMVGYHYTVLQLGTRLLTTVWLCLALIVVNALLVHWLVVNRRKLALKEARRRWLAAKEEDSAGGGEIPSAPDAPALDMATVADQANRFLRNCMAFVFILGIWVIWVDVLPALGILRNYELWTRQVRAAEMVAGASGASSIQIVEKVEPVTLADVLFAAVLVLMTVMAARNLPGMLEIALLQRLKLDHGARYAVATIARYVITMAGGIVALRALGVGWNNVQWMAAAVSVGLGFGLQEIFANFVSGLILLFERPIRAGDVVMVNGILGKVGRIQIRATTIYDMDHKELIIPNKEFITGQVINYTLSDTVIRLTVTVGVARGSDYEEARNILLRLAAEHPIILDDPAPIAALSEFKESSVEFLLFVHLPDLNNFLSVRHDLIAGIEREFTRAGIRIPFPQRDLHVHGPEEAIPVMVRRGEASRRPIIENALK